MHIAHSEAMTTPRKTMKQRSGAVASSAADGPPGLSDSSAGGAGNAPMVTPRRHISSRHLWIWAGLRYQRCPSTEIRFGATPASADEWDSKTDKMRDIARQRRYWIVSVVLPRMACCALLLVFLRALAYRLGDDVVMPDRASVLPLPPTLQQDFAEPRTLISGENANEFIDELGLDSNVKDQRRTNEQLIIPRRDVVPNAQGRHHHIVTEGLLHRAMVKASNEYGPRAPQRRSRGIHGPLSDLERQGHDVGISLRKRADTKVTRCKVSW